VHAAFAVKYMAHERRVHRRDSGKIAGHRRPLYHPRRFPGLAAAVGKLTARALVLDGEVAIYDQELRSRFEWLRDPDPDAVASPPVFMAFDLLYHDRRDLCSTTADGDTVYAEGSVSLSTTSALSFLTD
jgi:hypothetical protein